jgi:hypothetical protein
MISVMFFFLSEAAFKSDGCHEGKFRAVLDKTEAMIVRSANFYSGVIEMPTRRGSYECARYSFLLDEGGHPTDVRLEESSGSFPMNFASRQTLVNYVFDRKAWRAGNRLMMLFSDIVGRAPPRPSEVIPDEQLRRSKIQM